MLNTETTRNEFLNRNEYNVVSTVTTKSGLVRTAKIYKEGSTWTIKYTAPTTNFKHNLKSYAAAVSHLNKLGW